jgi:hypothetical protein
MFGIMASTGKLPSMSKFDLRNLKLKLHIDGFPAKN